jgi:hypothetical protein
LSQCTLSSNTAWGGGGTAGGSLAGCALMHNYAPGGGGGTAGASLNNCTLASNWSDEDGGGAYYATLNNCTVTSNSAFDNGGGVFNCTLTNCLLSGNSTGIRGGGAQFSTLCNCTLTGNLAGPSGDPSGGGGVSGSTLYNCIVFQNTATNGADYASDCSFHHSCTTPLPPDGFGNITNEPVFVDLPGGDFHLRPDSPCINAGNNAYVTSATDLDGNPRILNGTVDIGAYEYQGPGSTISYAWLQQFGLPTDGSADHADPDADRSDNWQEWMADTNPTNAASALRLSLLSNTPPTVAASSTSIARLYTLLACTNLTSAPASPRWTSVSGQIDLPGTGGLLLLTDTNPPAPAFYRVSVRFR